VLYTGITGDLKRRLAEHQRNPQGFVWRLGAGVFEWE
jgi:predicted GIY-YIG superfamily endonuclease